MLHYLAAIVLAQTIDSSAVYTDKLEEITIQSGRETVISETPASTTAFTREDLGEIHPTHPNELFSRSRNTWITRGSGQESLIAIRSPVLTGAGACGAFQILEDNVSIRPAGFCNVNQLLELNYSQASKLTVTRGPGRVVNGSNALHGSIAAYSATPGIKPSFQSFLEAGAEDYYRAEAQLRGNRFAIALNGVSSGSFRDDESYLHYKGNMTFRSGGESAHVQTSLAWADLDQETAGFIFGKDSYRDPALRTANLNQEAFRRARAVRLVSRWQYESEHGVFEWIPYARGSDMTFLQHYLPGKPLESNDQNSAGLRFSWRNDTHWSAGVDLEYARGGLTEFQQGPVETDSPFLQETRPQGYHYDYKVESKMFSAWTQYASNLTEKLSYSVGLRNEFLSYRYKNFLPVGNTRDDGTECGFGGCLYTRPGNRNDSFNNLAPDVSFQWRMRAGHQLWLRFARGFRVPQATELYRLQRGQEVADLESTTLDSVELGYRLSRNRWQLETSVFAMRKDHVIFRDANGFNVSDGRTRHAGIEARLDWQISKVFLARLHGSWMRQVYDFDRPVSAGELIRKGNEVDTAPGRLGWFELQWLPVSNAWASLEWAHTGSHYIDASNRHRYGGHSLINLRAAYSIPGGKHQVGLRLSNLFNQYYAERADFAFGNYRYFPGATRQLYLYWQFQSGQ